LSLDRKAGLRDAMKRWTLDGTRLNTVGIVHPGSNYATGTTMAILLSALAMVPVLSLIAVKGSAWTVHHYFWVDLAVAPAMAMFLAAIATGRPDFLLRLLASRPLRSLGNFSYSLYLIHLPIVMVVVRKIAPNYVSAGLPTFCFTVVVGLPASVLSAWLFAEIFEMPFKRKRNWRAE